MPLYVYRCEDCGVQIEKKQSFTDDPLTVCESCQGRLRKVIQPSVVIYKGSGFYCTDNKTGLSGNGRNGSSNKKEDSSKSDGDGAGSSEGKTADVAKAGAGED